jgi:hypothetical protein
MAAVLILCLTLTPCLVPDHVTTSATAVPSAQSNTETHQIEAGSTLTLTGSGITVTFVAVREDSRCPTGVQCIWEGDAAVGFRVARGTAEAVLLELHTSDRFARESQAHGVTIRLERLDPHPSADQPVAPNAYVATLAVTR